MKYIIDIPEKFKYTVEMGITQNGSIRSKAILNAVKDAIPYEERPHGTWLERYYKRFKYYCSNCGSGTDRKGKFCDTCGADMRERCEVDDKKTI